MEMSRLTRDGTAKPVSRDQILRRERGQGNVHFPCSADHEQDWQPYLWLILTLGISATIHTYIHKVVAGLKISQILFDTYLVDPHSCHICDHTYIELYIHKVAGLKISQILFDTF